MITTRKIDPLHMVHRPVDWRKLNLDQSVRPRRCYDRRTYGQLQPMEPEDRSAKWFLGLAVAVAAYFITRSVV